ASLVAALLGLALLIGLAASGGFVGAASSQFSSVGYAVNGAGSNDQRAIGLPGVNPTSNAQHLSARGAPVPQAAPPADSGVTTGATQPNIQQQASGSPATQQSDLSKIIRDGQIAVTIDRGTFKQQAGAVAHIAAANGGSILSSSTDGGDSGSFTIRIPA